MTTRKKSTFREKQIRDLARAMYQQRYGGTGLTYNHDYWVMCATEALDALKSLGYTEVV